MYFKTELTGPVDRLGVGCERRRGVIPQFWPEAWKAGVAIICNKGGAKLGKIAELIVGHVYKLSSSPHVGRNWWQLALGVWAGDMQRRTENQGWPDLQGASGGDDPALVLQH